MAYFISRTMCSTPVVYLSLVWVPPGLCTLALLLNPQVIMQSLATCRQVPLCLRCAFSIISTLWMTALSHSFFLFSFLFSSFSIIWGIFCMTMQGGPGSPPAQLRMVAGPHISSCKLRPGTSILYNCWEHGVCLLQFSSHAVARPACPA